MNDIHRAKYLFYLAPLVIHWAIFVNDLCFHLLGQSNVQQFHWYFDIDSQSIFHRPLKMKNDISFNNLFQTGVSDPGGQLPTQYLRESPLGGQKISAKKNFFCPINFFSAYPIQNPFRRPWQYHFQIRSTRVFILKSYCRCLQ